MKHILRLLLVSGVVVWLLGGCTQKIEPKPITYSQLLTGTEKKTWRMVSIIINDDGQSSGAIPVSNLNILPCITDDLFTFYANAERKFEASEGATKCDPKDDDIYYVDTWALVNANATLEFLIPVLGGKYPWTIKNLTDKVLTVEYYFPDINASYRFTFNSVTTK